MGTTRTSATALMTANGYKVVDDRRENGWYAAAVKRA